MWKGKLELNGKTYIVDVEWSGKRGTYNQWWRTWCAEIVDGKIPRRYWGSYWNNEDWFPLCGCVEVGYYTPYPLKTKDQVVAALGAMLARSKTKTDDYIKNKALEGQAVVSKGNAEQRRVLGLCPECDGEGKVFDAISASVQECDACDGWGISNRSTGG